MDISEETKFMLVFIGPLIPLGLLAIFNLVFGLYFSFTEDKD